MTNLRQTAQQALEALERYQVKRQDFDRFADEITALRTALEQQAEPVAWDKPSASFNAWWDSYRHDPANPFAEGSAAYWAWAGWQAAQRQWVGLTKVQRDDFADAYGSYESVCAIEQALKEKNT